MASRFGVSRRNGYTTQIEFFRDRLDSNFIGLLLFPILVGLVIPYLLIGVISSGAVVQSLTAGLAPDWSSFQALDPSGSPIRALHGGVPPWLGSLVICFVVLVYVFFGGMRGTTWANTFQTLIFMVLGVVTFFVIATRLGGQDSIMENLNALAESVPEDRLTRSEMSKTKFFTYLLIPLSVGMFPHLFQHWMTAKNANTFKLPVILHPVFIMIVWVPCVLVGIWATGNLIPPKPPLPSNPNTILPFLVKTQTGAILGGFLAAGILAAIMSSLDSQFLCIGTIFNNDIVTHYLGKENVSDQRQVLFTRLFIIGIVALTYLLSLGNVRSVFAMGVWCFSGFQRAVSHRRGRAVLAGTLRCRRDQRNFRRHHQLVFYQGIQVPISEGGLSAFVLHLPLGGEFYEIMPVVVMIASSAITMIVVSLITPKPNEATLAKFFDPLASSRD